MPINTKINSSEYSHISEVHEHDILVLSREIFLHGEINDEDGEDAGINSAIHIISAWLRHIVHNNTSNCDRKVYFGMWIIIIYNSIATIPIVNTRKFSHIHRR